jgi:hypothetical protein
MRKKLFISKQETIKRNKGNDGDATTPKVNLMRLKRQLKKSSTKIIFQPKHQLKSVFFSYSRANIFGLSRAYSIYK